jgi:hypothetical protein
MEDKPKSMLIQPGPLALLIMMLAPGAAAQAPSRLQNADLTVEASQSDRTYSIRSTRNSADLTARGCTTILHT